MAADHEYDDWECGAHSGACEEQHYTFDECCEDENCEQLQQMATDWLVSLGELAYQCPVALEEYQRAMRGEVVGS